MYPGVPTTAPNAVRKHWLSRVPLAAVWIAAAWPLLLWLLHRADPEFAVRVQQIAGYWLLRAAIAALVALLVGCALFPPLPAGLRLFGSRVRLALTSDRGQLLRVVDETRAHIVDSGEQTMTLEITGEPPHVDAVIARLEPLGIVEMVRTGQVAMRRGDTALSTAQYS